MSEKAPEFKGFAQKTTEGRLFAPAAARNLEPIAQELAQVVPLSGTALEIASGTGQHITAHARAHPSLIWHPSDIDADRRASIDAYGKAAGLRNLLPAVHLDATRPGWSQMHPSNLVLLCNLLHLISTTKAQTLVSEAAKALRPKGVFFLYGPFMRIGALTSQGDADFHQKLQTLDPEVGYKDDTEIEIWAQDAGLTLHRKTEMPANNLAFTFKKP